MGRGARLVSLPSLPPVQLPWSRWRANGKQSPTTLLGPAGMRAGDAQTGSLRENPSKLSHWPPPVLLFCCPRGGASLLLGPRQLGSAHAKRHGRVERVKGRQQQYRALLFHFWRGQNSIRFVFVPEKEYYYYSSPLLLTAATAAAATAAASCILPQRPFLARASQAAVPISSPSPGDLACKQGQARRAKQTKQVEAKAKARREGGGSATSRSWLAAALQHAGQPKTHTHKEHRKNAPVQITRMDGWMDGWVDHGLIRMGRPENAPLGPPPSGVTPLALGSDAKHPTQE